VAHPWQLVFGASLAENHHVSLAGLCRPCGKSPLLYAKRWCGVTPCWLARIGFEKVTMAGYGRSTADLSSGPISGQYAAYSIAACACLIWARAQYHVNLLSVFHRKHCMARQSVWAPKVFALIKGGNVTAAIAQIKVAPSVKDLTDLRKLLVHARLLAAHANVDAALGDMVAALSAPRLHRSP